jgi:hypothetical protein
MCQGVSAYGGETGPKHFSPMRTKEPSDIGGTSSPASIVSAREIVMAADGAARIAACSARLRSDRRISSVPSASICSQRLGSDSCNRSDVSDAKSPCPSPSAIVVPNKGLLRGTVIVSPLTKDSVKRRENVSRTGWSGDSPPSPFLCHLTLVVPHSPLAVYTPVVYRAFAYLSACH